MHERPNLPIKCFASKCFYVRKFSDVLVLLRVISDNRGFWLEQHEYEYSGDVCDVLGGRNGTS